MLREIVVIDESKCDGCGLCVPACEEGAIRIIDGKARLVSDVLCDGLGACLGHCPQDAIHIEKREADAFDEAAVAAHLGHGDSKGHATASARPPVPTPPPAKAPHPAAMAGAGGCPGAAFKRLADSPQPHSPQPHSPQPHSPQPPAGGCPSSRFAQFDRSGAPARPAPSDGSADTAADAPASELTHWPVQLRLLSPAAPVLRGASLLIAADCVPVAFPDFHSRLLRGRAVVIACPKLDDPDGYVEKLTAILADNEVRDITVAHMQVPCCTGILHMAAEARRRSGRNVPLIDMVISLQGEVLAERAVPAS